MRSYGVANRWWASMSSSPLFISVAESIVILPPIAHVGWRSASSTVTPASSARVRPRNGPPLAVSTSFSTVPAPWPGRGPAGGGHQELLDGPRALAVEQLVQRGVLGVHRHDARAGGLGEL